MPKIGYKFGQQKKAPSVAKIMDIFLLAFQNISHGQETRCSHTVFLYTLAPVFKVHRRFAAYHWMKNFLLPV